MPSMNPITQHFITTMQQSTQQAEAAHRHTTIVNSILAVRLLDCWWHNEKDEKAENILTKEEWTEGPRAMKKPEDKISINSRKYDVLFEAYTRNAIKRREKFLAEIEQEKAAALAAGGK